MSDSRFFDGYTWCSDDADCRLGLCMPGTDERAAAERFHPRKWYDAGKPIVVYTKVQPYDVPMRHVL